MLPNGTPYIYIYICIYIYIVYIYIGSTLALKLTQVTAAKTHAAKLDAAWQKEKRRAQTAVAEVAVLKAELESRVHRKDDAAATEQVLYLYIYMNR